MPRKPARKTKRKLPRTPPVKYEYRVVHQREAWEYKETHIWQSLSVAKRKAEFLASKAEGNSPIFLVYIERRPVGEWQEIITLVDE